MGNKYIIELEDKPFHKEDGDFLYRVKGFNSLVFDMTGIGKLISYTEPDLEQVRKEAYDKGFEDGKELCPVPEVCHNNAYQKGLSDAWDAARKLWKYGTKTLHKIFGEGVMRMDFFMKFEASEAIEKIRQYEQRQEEQIQVGDEIESDNERYVVLQKYLNNIDEPMAVLFNRRDEEISVFHLYNGNGAIFEKTGRHFSEIAKVLAKMKEN